MNHQFMQKAIDIAVQGIQEGHGPFGAIVVNNGRIVGMGRNQVTMSLDPTAHAEIVSIREACAHLNTHILTGCTIYTSCEPCPMCLGAILWSRLDGIYYGTTQIDAAKAGFDDQNFYEELKKPQEKRNIPMLQIMRPESLMVFETWKTYANKIPY